MIARKINGFKFNLFIIILLFSVSVSGQIKLDNPSFEDEPSDATVPHGWWACEDMTTPDIFPGFWGVHEEASDGDTYVGLITRPNNSWESIGQRFSEPLKKDNCYAFNMDLAHADTYAGYNNPLRLRVWISDKRCEKGQLIYESPLIDHTEWKTYPIKFKPSEEAKYIILEAYHHINPVSYKGNILIDNVSILNRCDRV